MVEINQDTTALKNIVITSLNKPIIVVGIPAFNEEKTIARIVLEAQRTADIVVVCDDGSSDLTGEIAEHLGADVIYHDHNSGYGAAMQSLFTRARQLKADVFVTLDGDGQHDPDEIKRLVKPITDGKAEVVLGSRFIEKAGTTDMPLYRQIGIKVITKLVNGAAKDGVSDAQSGFRAYSKYALEHLGGISEDGMSASVELLRSVHENGLKVCEVPITCKYEDSVGVKTSTENPVSHGIGVIMSIVRLIVEERPLTALGIPGILFLVTGLSLGIWMLEIYTIENIIVTNIALASLAFTIFGFFMLSTSITLYAISRLTRKLRDRS